MNEPSGQIRRSIWWRVFRRTEKATLRTESTVGLGTFEGDRAKSRAMVSVQNGLELEAWTLTCETIAAHRSYQLTIVSPTGDAWNSAASDVFQALIELRVQLEPLGLSVCCNGARRNAWASGMLRDMGQGLSVYLLDLAQGAEKPPMAITLGPAPAESVATVAEQLEWYKVWLKRPRT
jgi:hypothetical protein